MTFTNKEFYNKKTTAPFAVFSLVSLCKVYEKQRLREPFGLKERSKGCFALGPRTFSPFCTLLLRTQKHGQQKKASTISFETKACAEASGNSKLNSNADYNFTRFGVDFIYTTKEISNFQNDSKLLYAEQCPPFVIKKQHCFEEEKKARNDAKLRRILGTKGTKACAPLRNFLLNNKSTKGQNESILPPVLNQIQQQHHLVELNLNFLCEFNFFKYKQNKQVILFVQPDNNIGPDNNQVPININVNFASKGPYFSYSKQSKQSKGDEGEKCDTNKIDGKQSGIHCARASLLTDQTKFSEKSVKYNLNNQDSIASNDNDDESTSHRRMRKPIPYFGDPPECDRDPPECDCDWDSDLDPFDDDYWDDDLSDDDCDPESDQKPDKIDPPELKEKTPLINNPESDQKPDKIDPPEPKEKTPLINNPESDHKPDKIDPPETKEKTSLINNPESDHKSDKKGSLEQSELKKKTLLVNHHNNNKILKPSVALIKNEKQLNSKQPSDLDSKANGDKDSKQPSDPDSKANGDTNSKQPSDVSKTENSSLIKNQINNKDQKTKKPTLIPNPKYFFVPSLTVEQITNLVQIPPPKKEYERVFYRPGHPHRTSRIYLQNVMTEEMLQRKVEFLEKKEEDEKQALLKQLAIEDRRIWLYSILTFMVTRNTAPEAKDQKKWTKFTFFVLLKLRLPSEYLEVRYGFDLKRNPKWLLCKNCNQIIFEKLARRKNSMCYLCKHYIEMSSRDRRNHLLDGNTWVPMNEFLSPEDKLHFMDNMPFIERIAKYQQQTGLIDAVETGLGFIENMPVAFGVMEFHFMGGSMGSVVGEKIARLIRYSTRHGLPVILVTASGGARMQEGAISLAQMSKISGTLYYHQRCAHYMSVSVLTSPTTGGVTASFGMLGDVVIAEPRATIAFAGRRVIEQTLGEILPPHFQTAEHLYEQGLVDLVIDRPFLRCVLIILLRINFETPNRVFKPGPGKILDLTRILDAPNPVLTPVLN